MTTQRELLKNAFLQKCNLKDFQLEKIPSDASFRNYDRIIQGEKTFILMDAPPEHENVKQFVTVANFLEKQGFSAPKIFQSDIKNGFLLLEDFGTNSFTKLLNDKSQSEVSEERLYSTAVDTLLTLHKSAVPDNLIPYYSDDLLVKEAFMLIEWYIPVLNGEKVSKKLHEEYEVIWRHLLQYTRYIPETTVLKDFHADNLMWLEDRSGFQRVGILDFQDAIIGSPVYDMVSLLEDARRDVNDTLAQNMITRYLDGRQDITRKDFLAAYSILGAQRNLRIVGTFARKAVRDKNSAYLKLLPRVWGYIEKDLKHPLLLPLKGWLDKVISPKVRNPQSQNNSNEKISV